MREFWKESQEALPRRCKGSMLPLIGFVCCALSACAQTPLAVYDSSQQGQTPPATLALQDSAMFFEEVEGTQVSGEHIHRKALPLTVRSLELRPGTYHISLVYEHLAQPKCWRESGFERCWAVRDRGWWLPGSTLLPAEIQLTVEPDSSYLVTQVSDYWDMPGQVEWHPRVTVTTP